MSKLGSLLVREGLLTEPDRRMIHRESGTHRGSFARSILALGVIDEYELAALFAAKTSYRIASKNLSDELQDDVLGLIPAHILNWLDVLPLKRSNGVLQVAMTDPTDREVIAQLEFFSGMIIKPVIASFSTIHRALNKHLGTHQDFGRSEFEEFLKNHSVSATKFATDGLTMNKPAKAASSSSDEIDTSFDTSDGMDDSSNQIGSEDDQVGVESMSFSPNEETGRDASTGVAETVDDTVMFEGDSDISVSATGDSLRDPSADSTDIEEIGVKADSAAGSLGQDIDVSGLDGDLDFDLDDDGNEISKGKTAAVVPTDPVSANLDDILSSSSTTDLTPDADLSEGLGDVDTLTMEADVAIDPAEPDAVAASQDQPSVDDFSLPDDIMGDLGDATPLAAAPELADEVAAESSVAVEDSLSMSMDEQPDELMESIESMDTHDLAAGTDIDVAATAEPDAGDLDLETLSVGNNSMDVSPAGDAFATQDADFDNLEDLGVTDIAASPVPSPVAEDVLLDSDVSGKAHTGIAALNRALVNMALLMDSKKALTRAADAAGQVGIESGSIALWDQTAVKPGVMWSRSGAELGVIYDAPAGLSEDAAKFAVTAAAGRDEWFNLADGLSASFAGALVSAWPNSELAPTHVAVKKRHDGSYVIGLARFSGDADHDGLKQSFAELVKTAGAKM